MDDLDPFESEGDGEDFAGDAFDDTDAPDLDAFDDAEVPDGDDLDDFDFAGEAESETDMDEDFGVDAEYEDDADDEDEAAGGEETAYAATYEDALLGEADNPPSFPPELDLDLPEPVDGYPWVDLDAMGTAEAEPWVNAVETSPYALADIDDPAASALARFWQS